jgi:hypothetical protein
MQRSLDIIQKMSTKEDTCDNTQINVPHYTDNKVGERKFQ